jgi:hypothetical protein
MSVVQGPTFVIHSPEELRALCLTHPELRDSIASAGLMERVEDVVEENLIQEVSGRRFLFYNSLSRHWTWLAFCNNPVIYPLLYIAGMLTYAVSLVLRIMVFIFTLLRWVIGPCVALYNQNGFYAEMKERTEVMLAALAELGSACVGVCCPPIAYLLDEKIQSNTIAHKWYLSWCFSLWSDEVDSATNGGSEQDALEELAIKKDIHHFKNAKENLDKYLSQADEVDSISGVSLELIMYFGFLGLLYQHVQTTSAQCVTLKELHGTTLGSHCEHALAACRETAKNDSSQIDKIEKDLLGLLEKFRMCWLALTSGSIVPPTTPVSQEQDLLIQGVKAVLVLKAGHHVVYCKKEIPEQLQKELKELEQGEVVYGGETVTRRTVVENIAATVQNFTHIFKANDRAYEATLLRLVYT